MSAPSLVLCQYPADCRPLKVEPLGNAGGMSGAVLWRVIAPRGLLALRRWPREHPSATRLQWIHGVLRHAASQGITFLPVPILDRLGRSFISYDDHLWEFASWLPGTASYEQSPTSTRLAAALKALATFHLACASYSHATPERPVATGASPAIARRLRLLREVDSRFVTKLGQAIDTSRYPAVAHAAGPFLTLVAHAAPRVAARLEPLLGVRFSLQPCLRDIWHDHVLFTGETVSGLLDFGAMGVDTPAVDISRLLGSLVGDDPLRWQFGLDAYQQVSPLSDEMRRAIPLFDASGILLAGCNWLRWIYLERRTFPSESQVSSRFATVVDRAQRLVSAC